MIILSNITDRIVVNLTATVSNNQLSLYSSYRDTNLIDSIVPYSYATFSNNLNYVSIVGTTSIYRSVDYLSVYNRDDIGATANIYYHVNDSEIYHLFGAYLNPKEKIEYQEGYGFKVLDNGSEIKTTLNYGDAVLSTSQSSITLYNSVVNIDPNANTLQDSGLSFSVDANRRYYFRFQLSYTSAATTTGSRWVLFGPTASELRYYSKYSLAATTETTNHGMVTYSVPANSNATTPAGGGISIIEGFVAPLFDGNMLIRFASGVSASAVTVATLSCVFYQAL